MYTPECKTELTMVEPEALPGAVCDSENNLKAEAGVNCDRTTKTILDSVTRQ